MIGPGFQISSSTIEMKYLKVQVTSILVASSMDVRQISLQNTLKGCLLLKGNVIVNSKIQMDWMSKDTQQ